MVFNVVAFSTSLHVFKKFVWTVGAILCAEVCDGT